MAKTLCPNCDPEFLMCGDCANYNIIKEYCVLHDIEIDASDCCESFYCRVAMKLKLKRLGIDNVE